MYVGSADERQLMDEIKSMASSGAVSSTGVVRPGMYICMYIVYMIYIV